jgi:CheY-like chemotaxis protein
MGGRITVDSALAQGTSFHVVLTLPCASGLSVETHDLANAVADFEVRLHGLGHSLRILFAEDNPTNQFVVLQLLKGFDVQVDVVNDGLEAVDAATSFAYDLIYMDMRMPELDGLQATQAIRRRGGRLASIPIIALTASAFPEDVTACLNAGMTDFVAKPVRKDLLIAATVRAMDSAAIAARGASAARAAVRPDTETKPASPHVAGTACDRTALDALARDIGEASVLEMVAVFLAETDQRLARMAASQVSVADLIREAHTLRGAASTACAPRLAALAAVLETKLQGGGTLEASERRALGRAFDDYRWERGACVATAATLSA